MSCLCLILAVALELALVVGLARPIAFELPSVDLTVEVKYHLEVAVPSRRTTTQSWTRAPERRGGR